MRSRHHLDAQFPALFQQLPARATIGIKDMDRLIVGAVFFNGDRDGFGNLVGVKMQVRGQALQIKVIPVVLSFDRQHFMRQSPACDQQNPARARECGTLRRQGVVVQSGHKGLSARGGA